MTAPRILAFAGSCRRGSLNFKLAQVAADAARAAGAEVTVADFAELTMPLFKRMFRALYISRSLSTMGELLNAGVPMLDTIAITGDISGNLLYKKMWRNVYAAVKQGKKVQSQLTRSTLLPRSVVQMIGAGEESGRLGEVLEEISVFYQKTLREAIKAVTSMIEPIMIIVMGGIVGFIAMAIILPIFKMSNLVGG